MIYQSPKKNVYTVKTSVLIHLTTIVVKVRESETLLEKQIVKFALGREN